MAGYSMNGTLALCPDGVDIDRRRCHRVVPMKVLVLGLCRTGTLSVRVALRTLGYLETYHMRSASTESPRDCEMWMDALKAKFDGQGSFGREEWDMLLGHCQAVCDFPAAAFAPELIAAYPDAKVILTNRDVDSWHRSCTQTIYRVVKDPTFKFLSHFDWAFQLYQPMLSKLWDCYFQSDFPNRGKDIYLAHYAEIRRLVPKEQLLEYNVADGWGPLCDFLKEAMPSVTFPISNTIADFNRGAAKRNQKKLWKVFVKVGVLSFCVIAMAMAIIKRL